MRKLLNTLYITNPDAYLTKDGLNVVVSVKQVEVLRIPILNIESIIYFGYMGASPGLMKLCTDNHVSLTFMSPSGHYIARIQGATYGNVLLRTKQYALSKDEDFSLHLSSHVIAAKIQNYRNILQRFVRDYGENADVSAASNLLRVCKEKALRASTADILRGVEGDAANSYFGVFNQLILHNRADFPFNGRNRRPPRDAVNAMLSFAYTMIANDYTSALETVGLDPYVGFLHTLRPGRASLSLDLMEELRAYLGDRFVLSLINRKQLTGKDFKQQGEDSMTMTDDARKVFLSAWQSRKKEEIIHPYLNEKIPIGLLPYVQAQLLSRFLRGDIEDYPVFIVK